MSASPASFSAAPATTGRAGLPELAGVPWRPRVDERGLDRSGRLWTLSVVAHTVPLVCAAVVLGVLSPVTIPLGVILIAHAWIIPELYAARGAVVVRGASTATGPAEATALALLGDLVGHEARELHARTGLVLERGRLGAWLIGDAGALLVRPAGRRVVCFCVKVTDGDLPPADRTAHLLLALRTDELGFATVANTAFSGARWRLRRRVPERCRPALDRAAHAARAARRPSR